MLKNYLVIAFRNIIRSRATSIINILGLGLGVGVFMLIILYVNQETSVDKFIKDNERIYRLEAGDWALLGPGFADLCKEITPDVEDAITMRQFFLKNEFVLVDKNPIAVTNYIPVSNSFFDFFGFDVVEGNSNPLSDPYDIVLTRSESKRLFGDENPIGKTITIYDNYTLTVKAIVNDPNDFHIKFNALLSFDIIPILYRWKDMSSMLFRNMNNPTYLKLVSPNQKEVVLEKITGFLEEMEKSKLPFALNLRPVEDVYFNGAIPFEGEVRHGNVKFISVMVIVAILILFLACVNYINLSTAKASARAKEIGIRKTVGGSKLSIIGQFLGESILITLIALLIGFVFLELSAPFFSLLVERELTTETFINPQSLLVIVLSTVILGIISGLYPALHLSKFSPSKVLKGDVGRGAKGATFRKVLIVFQFSVSVALIISTIIIFSQLSYFTNYDVGFNKDQIINFKIPRNTTFGYDVFKDKVLKIPSVKGISQSTSKFGSISWQESFRKESGETVNYSYVPVDPDFIDLFDLELVEGRNFDWNRPTDFREALVINETMAKMIGDENIIGHILSGGFVETKIIGVVKDFNYNSLHSDIGPLGLHFRGRDYTTYNIKVETDKISEAIEGIKNVWDEYSIEAPFEYSFLNESFESTYRSELRMGKMFGYFAAIAIFIGCMGLFGLSAFILQARVKEMGIRKVLGASTYKIIGLMSKEFVTLVLISNAIAWPIAWYAMDKWLQGFPYKASIQIVFFFLGLLLSISVALLTVSYHSWKTARSNPVDSLKYE